MKNIILNITVLQLYSFDFSYSLFVLGKDFWSGEKGSDIIKKKFPKHIAFHFFKASNHPSPSPTDLKLKTTILQ
jgi:hypothetical protein